MTVLGDELFILIDGIKFIEVYDLTAFCLLRSIPIPKLEYSVDLTSDPLQEHLHIVGNCEDGLYQIVTIDRTGRVIKEYPTSNGFGCLS